jgi:hypothetical protein
MAKDRMEKDRLAARRADSELIGQVREYSLRYVLAGEAENVRASVCDALERLGYQIADETPAIQARRGARGWGKHVMSANVLDYPIELTITLKSVAPNVTRASFHYLFSTGLARRAHVLAREAETIIALASRRATTFDCAVCGAVSNDNSRFCRRCGAPLEVNDDALRILRLTAEIDAARSLVSCGTAMTLSSSLLMIVSLLIVALASAPTRAPLILGLLIGGVLLLFGAPSLVFGWRRLKRALASDANLRPQLITRNDAQTKSLSAADTKALLAARERVSVTEATTELLDSSAAEEIERKNAL